MKKDSIDILNEGLIASAILSSFEKRYPSMRITGLSDIQFDKKNTPEFMTEFSQRLHIYQAGFKDCLKFQKNLRLSIPDAETGKSDGQDDRIKD